MTGLRCPYAILTACSQSHAFDERRINIPCSEDESVKIGRSVARWKPNVDNAIFDCKVLSRNHAILWYEDGYFLLKDTKSSNGTFVNNDRLSKSAEESAPRQIYSGDILQFGVDIVENTNKVTHGCIVAMVRLFDASGDEVCPPEHPEQNCVGTHDTENSSMMYPLINSHQLYQLQQYVREATHRERALEQKLAVLETILTSTEEAAETSWQASFFQALINEDRLLSRIEMLEGQLALYSKSAQYDKSRDQVNELLVDKNKFETLAKESLRRAQEERYETLQRLADVERCLLNAEEEATVLRERAAGLEDELAQAVHTNASLRRTISILQRQMNGIEAKFESIVGKNHKLSSLLKLKDESSPDSSRIDSQTLETLIGDNDTSVVIRDSIDNVNGLRSDVIAISRSQKKEVTANSIKPCDRCNQTSDDNLCYYSPQNCNVAVLLLCVFPFFTALFIAFRLGTLVEGTIQRMTKKHDA